jgi:hypothetical protein
MVACVYCQRPLICETCQTEYAPPTQEAYEALMRPELPVICPECEAIVVCHWCKTPYDGGEAAEEVGD